MNQISIETKLGTLKAYVRDDPDYPGIDIRLERNEQELLVAWVESVESCPLPALQMRLYASCADDSPTDGRQLFSHELDAYFDALSQEAE